MAINFHPTPKQMEALGYLYDDHTEEILFGGGAGGGKSVLGCFWIISNALNYDGTRWLLGRAVLKNLKQTTVKTLFRLMGNSPQIDKGLPPEVRFGLRKDIEYKYNATDGEIIFNNGSEIVFKDLMTYPADPEFDSLGSAEYTGAFLDEVSQISVKGKEIVQTRLRHRTKDYGILGKTLACTNPCKNWAYKDFYKPWKEKTIDYDKKFIQALAKDNKFIDPNYILKLKKRDPITKERLLMGNWEYSDDPSRLFDYDDIMDLFTNVPDKSDEKYLTCDVARKGKDLTTIFYWEGLLVRGIWAYQYVTQKSKLRGVRTIYERHSHELVKILNEKADKLQVKRSHICIDEDGVGGGANDEIPGSRGFINNSAAIPIGTQQNNFSNLKTQCFFKLADLVKQGKVGIRTTNEDFKEALIEELEQIKQDNIDNDVKISLIKKKDIKEMLGRSPDFADNMMMRMLFEVSQRRFRPLKDIENVTGLF